MLIDHNINTENYIFYVSSFFGLYENIIENQDEKEKEGDKKSEKKND